MQVDAFFGGGFGVAFGRFAEGGEGAGAGCGCGGSGGGVGGGGGGGGFFFAPCAEAG